jgi:coenzyme F420 hydrogenase subunit delta
MFKSRVMVFGCGNTLFGDDAMGPAVIGLLQEDPELPEDVGLLDVGTSIRMQIFDLLHSDAKPERVVVVDAVTEEGRAPGEIWEISVEDMDPKKIKDFSMHQFPTVNMLKELRDTTGVDVKIVVAQTGWVPETMEEGFSDAMREALPKVAARVKELCRPE